MNISETLCGAVTVLAINGKLDGFSSPGLETEINRLISQKVQRVVFDCSGIEYLSSAGLRVFLATARRLQAYGGRCGFAALSAETQKIFRLTNCFEVLEIHNTVADACC